MIIFFISECRAGKFKGVYWRGYGVQIREKGKCFILANAYSCQQMKSYICHGVEVDAQEDQPVYALD